MVQLAYCKLGELNNILNIAIHPLRHSVAYASWLQRPRVRHNFIAAHEARSGPSGAIIHWCGLAPHQKNVLRAFYGTGLAYKRNAVVYSQQTSGAQEGHMANGKAKYKIEHYGHGEWPCAADLDDINELNHLCFKQKPMTRDHFVNTFLANPMLIFIVARDCATHCIVGKWSCYIIPRDHGGEDAVISWTEQVAVHPEHQERGIARRLRKKMAAIARKKGVARDKLSSSKESAQKAYLKMGYEECNSKLFHRYYR